MSIEQAVTTGNIFFIFQASLLFIEQKMARIAKAASHKLPGKSSFNVLFVCPVCIRGRVKTAEMVPCGIYYSDTIDYS